MSHIKKILYHHSPERKMKNVTLFSQKLHLDTLFHAGDRGKNSLQKFNWGKDPLGKNVGAIQQSKRQQQHSPPIGEVIGIKIFDQTESPLLFLLGRV